MAVSGDAEFVEGVDMTSTNEISSTPLARPTPVEKHTPPILLSYSPKGSQQWIRKVEQKFTLRIGMEFDTLEDGVQFYSIYAIACGFDARRFLQRRFRDQTIRTKCIVFHREGFGECKKMKTLVNMETAEMSKTMKKVTTIRRFGCRSMIKLVFKLGKYVINQFHEGHNHRLVLVKNREFQKLYRNLALYHKYTIINHSKINIVTNGYENIGASLLDFKNFQREVKLFIGDKDAEMFISFQYAYHVDEGKNLCRKFMEAMGRRVPQMIITDQDPAIKNAVPAFFKIVRHRFYMWHIVNKFAEKIDIITRKDLQMGNIMSTTQRSKNENSFFKKFENHYGTLVEFWLRYESAMDQQRHTHKRLEMESNNSIPKKITLLSLETHALTVYTHELFNEIQEEIKSSVCGCGIVGHTKTTAVEVTTIEDLERKKKFAVQYNFLTSDLFCTCKLFERRGGPIYDLNENIIDNYDLADESHVEMSKVWSEFYNVISVMAKKEVNVLRNMQKVLKEFKDTIEPTTVKMSRQQEMEMLIGCSAPNEVKILPPGQSKNKGSGKRMLTSKNKVIEKAKKLKRRCDNCKRMAYHF
ncbi:hypothetical protein RND81_09G073500 [Saponaria officinalis]|uniref:Protein FAR1-RELATED SEQUENCE n=1 Tax=Saponaria officinalis TaxID=3572 RepID=A0AAW1IJY7_SAPOF